MRWFGRIALLLLLSFSSGCAPSEGAPSREYVYTPPVASIVVEDPCRYVGSLHRESRHQLERLTASKRISVDEWSCMARTLAELDSELTEACRHQAIAYSNFQERLRGLYGDCVPAERSEVLDQAVSLDPHFVLEE
jgi:hypothetical protein